MAAFKLGNQAIKILKKTPTGRRLVKEVKNAGDRVSSKLQTQIRNLLERSRDTGPSKTPGVTFGGGTKRSAVIGQKRLGEYTAKRRLEGAGAGAGAGAAIGYGVGKGSGKQKPKKKTDTGPDLFGAKKGGTVSRRGGRKIMQGYKAGGKV
jgi:hypothetical protein|tara:strand:+ start:76 stop:525 length:450 start_codon:yes stop_codon:yes gene_type:complete